MLERVGQRLLDDAERGELQPGRQRLGGRTVDGELDLQAGGADMVDEVLDLAQARLGRHLGVARVLAQDAEQAAHLGQRMAAGPRDVGHRGLGAVRRLADRVGRAVGKGDHHREVVRDDGLVIVAAAVLAGGGNVAAVDAGAEGVENEMPGGRLGVGGGEVE